MKMNARQTLRAVIGLMGLVAIAFALPYAGAQGTAAGLYKTKCAVCHGADGKGDTAVGKADKIRDLSSPDVQQQSDAELTAIVTGGKGKMPAYGKSLSPSEVTALVRFLDTLHPANQPGAVDASRAAIQSNAQPVKAEQ